jgi:hypothetical protein
VGGPMSDLTADIDGFAAVIEGTTPLARELGRANAHVSVRTRHMHVRFTHTRWLIQGGGGAHTENGTAAPAGERIPVHWQLLRAATSLAHHCRTPPARQSACGGRVYYMCAPEQDTAKRLFKDNEAKVRGRGEHVLCGACILIAARMEGHTIGLSSACVRVATGGRG